MTNFPTGSIVSDTPLRANSTRSRWALGTLIPLAMLLWCLVDLGLRFLPEEWFRIEPVQIATRLPNRYSPFVPNLKLYVENPVGEQALLANLRPTEKFPAMWFSTDSLGFRQTQTAEGNEQPTVVVFKGDSFTFGGSLSDDDTFPSALAADLHTNVFNAGRFFDDRDGVKELNWLLNRFESRPSTVVCVYLESHEKRFLSSYETDVRSDADRAGPASRLAASVIGKNRYLSLRDSLEFRMRRFGSWWNISPLKIGMIRGYKRLYNGIYLPNQSEEKIEVRTLPNSERLLVSPKKIQALKKSSDPKLVERTAKYLVWMRDNFARRNIDFWVLFLPDKESVYSEFLSGSQDRAIGTMPTYLEVLESKVSSHGVKSVNALNVLRAYSRQDWETGRLSYYREDHHWNPLGVHRVAEAMAESMMRTGWSPLGNSQIASSPVRLNPLP